VKRAASPAMSAVSPTEIANKVKAIRRHDCRRGKQDCSMSLSFGGRGANQNISLELWFRDELFRCL
jgi:hypothetical protein